MGAIILVAMDDQRLGRTVRALRHRLAIRQRDAAARAGVPQSTWSLVERGQIDRLQIRTVRAVVEAVGGQWDPGLRWRGGELDRLLDEGHAALVSATARLLERSAWVAQPEVTFSVFGERGSIDLLAWHLQARILLVVEVKTMLTSVEETLRRHDTKVRLAPTIASERYGWGATAVARLLVLPDSATSRRRVARHATVFRRAYPATGWPLRRWLRGPSRALSGLLFLSPIAPDDARRDPITRHRVRRADGHAQAGRSLSAIASGDGRLDSGGRSAHSSVPDDR